jgi:hypothetical protein
MSDPIRNAATQRKAWETPAIEKLESTLDDIKTAIGVGSDGGIETGISMS